MTSGDRHRLLPVLSRPARDAQFRYAARYGARSVSDRVRPRRFGHTFVHFLVYGGVPSPGRGVLPGVSVVALSSVGEAARDSAPFRRADRPLARSCVNTETAVSSEDVTSLQPPVGLAPLETGSGLTT